MVQVADLPGEGARVGGMLAVSSGNNGVAAAEGDGVMATLYVDVDDTLIAWDDPLEGRLTTSWQVNEAVCDFMAQWDGAIVIWSTGGANYAKNMTRRAHLPAAIWRKIAHWDDKFPRIPVQGEVFLDDMPLPSFAGNAIHPRDLA